MTDSSSSSSSSAPEQQPVASTAPARKPRFALFIATAFGLGYIPVAPGTWGSLAGLIIYRAGWSFFSYAWPDFFLNVHDYLVRNASTVVAALVLSALIAGLGVRASGRVSRFSAKKDPQFVVIDEVSGQHLTLLLGTALPLRWNPMLADWHDNPMDFASPHSVLSWKYLLLGLILFRVFDIWKPFPVRQAESLPGGWGIMADDWVAAIYAALGLWLARALGL